MIGESAMVWEGSGRNRLPLDIHGIEERDSHPKLVRYWEFRFLCLALTAMGKRPFRAPLPRGVPRSSGDLGLPPRSSEGSALGLCGSTVMSEALPGPEPPGAPDQCIRGSFRS